MKDFKSNSLRRELAAFSRVGEHPDADVLTAFIEGSLLERERRAVLEHVAGCPDCRGVLSLTADELPQVAASSRGVPIRQDPRPSWRSWLQGGAVATAIAIVCTVAIHYKQSRSIPAPPVGRTPATPHLMAQLQSPQTTEQAAKKKPAPAAHPKRAPQLPALASAESPASETVAVNALQQERGLTTSSPAVRNEALPEVKTQAASTVAMSPAFTGGAQAKAIGGPVAALPARPHWRINDQGQPERAFGEGPWQPVLTNESSKMRVLSIMGDKVWVGGENSRAYRSLDEGMTWQPVALPTKNGTSHTIVHIRFDTAKIGSIEADDGTIWTTSDGGDTWN